MAALVLRLWGLARGRRSADPCGVIGASHSGGVRESFLESFPEHFQESPRKLPELIREMLGVDRAGPCGTGTFFLIDPGGRQQHPNLLYYKYLHTIIRAWLWASVHRYVF
jgi:hypothetical protein